MLEPRRVSGRERPIFLPLQHREEQCLPHSLRVDARDGSPTITRIAFGEHDWQKSLREGDIVRAVDGHKIKTRDEALRAIAAAQGSVRITVERHGNRVTRKIALP